MYFSSARRYPRYSMTPRSVFYSEAPQHRFHGLNPGPDCAAALTAVILAQHCDACAERATRWAAEGAPVRPRISVTLVDSDAPKCQRPGCENVLYGRQTMFCTTRCSSAIRQQRHRDLARLELHDIDRIPAESSMTRNSSAARRHDRAGRQRDLLQSRRRSALTGKSWKSARVIRRADHESRKFQ